MAEYSKERASIFEPFIRYRVASNNWNEVYSQTLLYFDRFCSENYPGVKGITQEMINGWCIQRPTEQKASHWLEDGMNIAQISFLLGHSQLETTMIYLDITTEQEAAALATLEDESDRNAVPKWNPDTDSLSSICGLRKLQ